MIGFGFDVPYGDLEYQLKTEVHVIGEVRVSQLTPKLSPPVVVLKRVEAKEEKKEEKKEPVVVYFDFDSAKLKEREKKKLLGVDGKVRIEGFASPEGPERYNLKLSERRAQSVAKFLQGRGVEVLSIKGLGERPCKLPPKKWKLCRKAVVFFEDR